MKFFLSIVLTAFLFSQNAKGQAEIIYLKNPSFEGTPKEGSLNVPMIPGWYDCGFPGETIPDIHPKPNSAFGVDTRPAHGETYIGLVVRDNDTWERVSQRLSSPLLAEVEYQFSISLARSLTYESSSKTNKHLVNFATPSKLRIWGGNSICDRGEKLAESDLIINSSWLENTFTFKPFQNFEYLILEAFYKTPTPFPYNGNILMDHASSIVPIGVFEKDSSRMALNDSLQKNLRYYEHNAVGSLKYDKSDYATPGSNLIRFEFTEPHMGTEFKIVLYAESDSLAKVVSNEAFARIAELELVFSDYRENSEVSRLSALAGTNQKMRVSDDLWNVLLYARKVTDRSKGAFDFTAGALTKLWRKSFRQKEMPSEAEIAQALKTIGIKNMTLGTVQEVELWYEGTQLDFGGIAKGYAVDEALKLLKNRATTRALVDGGGDIAVGEAPPGKEGWEIERMVYGELGKLTTEPITLVNQAIATSGHIERFLEDGGQRYSHIIDPRTGYGVTKREIVSVVAPTCAEADAWATALSVEVDTKVYLWVKKQDMRAYFSK